MQRAMLPSASPDDAVVLLRQKHMLLQVRDKGDGILQRRPNLQWKAQQLLRLAEELQAEWQEAQLFQDLEQLCSSHALGGAAEWAASVADEANEGEDEAHAEADPEEPTQRAAERALRAKEKHRVVLHEHKSHKEELPRQQARHPKPRRKAAGPERQGAPKTRGLGPAEKSKGKRATSSKSSRGRRTADPRVGRSLNPLLATAEELKYLEEKQRGREGRRRKAGKGTTVRFARGLRNSSEDHCSRNRLDDFQQLWPMGPSHKREAVAPTPPDKRSTKNKWQRELEFAFEQLFSTNRKLKRHLNLHLDSRPRKDQNPQEQDFLVMQGCGSGSPQERVAEVETLSAGESGDPAEAEVPRMSSKTDLKPSLSKAELLKYHQVAQPSVKDGSQTSLPEVRSVVEEEDLLSRSTECAHEASELATLLESTPEPHPQEPVLGADWMALGQRPRMEWRRQKPSFESAEVPDMSLEIHYSPQLEEERRERRKVRLALLRAYPNRYQTKDRGSFRTSSPSSSSIVDDEEKQNQMIRDIQLQISEQNKLHEEFLEKARKRLLEFQSVC
ncbi:protein DDC8 homolog [Sciurus carolinensis]|uniref:protein DDC8 homolog n=1 Tax=Sciurus carolinensis TaxID=30640 RepID=UPI001FB4D7B0|nr:protein DDC8 homolog [Sciurus carolinensis]